MSCNNNGSSKSKLLVPTISDMATCKNYVHACMQCAYVHAGPARHYKHRRHVHPFWPGDAHWVCVCDATRKVSVLLKLIGSFGRCLISNQLLARPDKTSHGRCFNLGHFKQKRWMFHGSLPPWILSIFMVLIEQTTPYSYLKLTIIMLVWQGRLGPPKLKWCTGELAPQNG